MFRGWLPTVSALATYGPLFHAAWIKYQSLGVQPSTAFAELYKSYSDFCAELSLSDPSLPSKYRPHVESVLAGNDEHLQRTTTIAQDEEATRTEVATANLNIALARASDVPMEDNDLSGRGDIGVERFVKWDAWDLAVDRRIVDLQSASHRSIAMKFTKEEAHRRRLRSR